MTREVCQYFQQLSEINLGMPSKLLQRVFYCGKHGGDLTPIGWGRGQSEFQAGVQPVKLSIFKGEHWCGTIIGEVKI